MDRTEIRFFRRDREIPLFLFRLYNESWIERRREREGLMVQKEGMYESARRASAHSFTREDPMNRLGEESITSDDDVFRFGVEMNTSINDPFTFRVESITSADDIFRFRT